VGKSHEKFFLIDPLLTQLKPQYGQRLFANGLQNAGLETFFIISTISYFLKINSFNLRNKLFKIS
jgi:hypothetical protein